MVSTGPSQGGFPPVGAGTTGAGGPGREPRRALWIRSAVVMAVVIGALYAIEAVDAATNNRLDDDGIHPRDADRWWGVLTSPFLHAGFDHLTSNAVPAAVLGFLLLLARRFVVTTLVVWAFSGIGVFLFGPSNAVTIGASGIIFGWLTFLLVRGLFNRSPAQIGIGLLLLVVYGSVLWGVVPGQPQISWQAHLFGAIGGVVAAWALAGRDRRRRRAVTAGTTPLSEHGR
ncbi:rhomboid family intramembrane serine protease [Williamsia sp. SKLECPSW1]